MGWATSYIAQLKEGKTVQFRPHGNSMSGRVENGQLVTVAPISDSSSLQVNDIVLCVVNSNQYLHIIKGKRGNQFLIGNNRGRINGWIDAGAIYGKMIS